MKWSHLAVLLLIIGCTPNSQFRTEIHNVPCLALSVQTCHIANLVHDEQDDYSLGFVEFDDSGRFYDKRQADALLQWLSNDSQSQYVVVYTHGWHHNASDADNNVRRFMERLREIKRRNPHQRVVGVYLGWRGETLELPWLRALTFWNRRAVSQDLGGKQFQEFLLNVETVVQRQENPQNRLLIIGHSLGAWAVLNALQPVWLQRLQDGHADLGSLVLLVNPAIEARRFADFRAAIRRTVPPQRPLSDKQRPLLVIAGSEADAITKNAFTWSRAVPAWFESLLDPIAEDDTLGATQWDLAATAIGHFPRFFTHRLEIADATLASGDCSRGAEKQPSVGNLPWQMADGLQLRALADIPTNNPPLWVVQTDGNVLPNHGFLTQQLFWCFIEQAMNLASSHDSLLSGMDDL
jgi:predicted alpha/beta hydrolase family esterase